MAVTKPFRPARLKFIQKDMWYSGPVLHFWAYSLAVLQGRPSKQCRTSELPETVQLGSGRDEITMCGTTKKMEPEEVFDGYCFVFSCFLARNWVCETFLCRVRETNAGVRPPFCEKGGFK